MIEKVYIESSIPSYLVHKPSRDLVIAARQSLTQQWWEQESKNYDKYISVVVLDEIRQGNPEYAAIREKIITHLPVLEVNQAVLNLANRLQEKLSFLPASAASDILHIALAIEAGMDFLLTWNCKHIANGQVMRWVHNY